MNSDNGNEGKNTSNRDIFIERGDGVWYVSKLMMHRKVSSLIGIGIFVRWCIYDLITRTRVEYEGILSWNYNYILLFLCRSLLKYESIEISYFAAGILANLMSDDPSSWTISGLPRNLMLMELETAIMSWKQADKEMVAYRSFKPFSSLLWCFKTYQSQLWALWAIQHVLTAHGE